MNYLKKGCSLFGYLAFLKRAVVQLQISSPTNPMTLRKMAKIDLFMIGKPINTQSFKV